MSDHILRDGRLGDIDSEFEQFAMNSRGSPKRIVFAHVADELTKILGNPWSPRLAMPAFPGPKQSESLAMLEMTVSGLTMTRAERHWGQKRRSQIQRNRSQARSFGRLTERFKTMIWCHRARISVWSARRDRKPARRTDDIEIRMFCINGEAISPIP